MDNAEYAPHTSFHGEGSTCGRQMASSWLSLLISVFSTILLVSAWLDFREQDQWESIALRSKEETHNEKTAISNV
ncbi:hypothetical protein F4819DRAFT_475252 [Hypoxylon fuscum]|nr:hypothetical protein F4819DRAFT_475252 [Hypoxylon fuscum]